MATNENINSEFKEKIQKLYPGDEFRYIGSIMETWTKKGFGAGIFGVLGNASVDRQKNKLEDIWQDLIPAMEQLITRNIDNSSYFIVFDELDEDYRNYWDESSRIRYLSLITSLMKSVSNVRRVFADHSCKALLHKLGDGRGFPFSGQTHPTTSVTGMPSAVKPFRTATRTWNSAT